MKMGKHPNSECKVTKLYSCYIYLNGITTLNLYMNSVFRLSEKVVFLPS